MALYEYRCRVCDAHFEARRPMAEAAAPIACPVGHAETTRLLSVFASVGTTAAARQSASVPAAATGGCGAGCTCVH